MVMVVFLQRWNGDGFENFSPSPLMVFGGINHWQQWFFNGFFQFWGPMVHDGQILGTNGSRWLQTEIFDKLHENKNVENRNARYRFISQKNTFYILHSESLIITLGMKNLNTLVTSDQGKSGAMAQDTQYKIDF